MVKSVTEVTQRLDVDVDVDVDGIEDSTLQENTTLFIEVQQFLTSCGRFKQRREPTQASAH